MLLNQGSKRFLYQRSKRFLNQGSKTLLNQKFRRFLNQRSTRFLNQGSKRFFNHGSKRFLNQGLKSFLNQGSKRFLNQGSKRFFNHGSKRSLNQGSKRLLNQGSISFLPSKYLLVFKTSWRRLQHIFSVKSFCLPRQLEDALGDKKLLRWRYLDDVLKTRLEGLSWRRFWDKQNFYGVSVYNKFVFHKSISDGSKA